MIAWLKRNLRTIVTLAIVLALLSHLGFLKWPWQEASVPTPPARVLPDSVETLTELPPKVLDVINPKSEAPSLPSRLLFGTSVLKPLRTDYSRVTLERIFSPSGSLYDRWVVISFTTQDKGYIGLYAANARSNTLSYNLYESPHWMDGRTLELRTGVDNVWITASGRNLFRWGGFHARMTSWMFPSRRLQIDVWATLEIREAVQFGPIISTAGNGYVGFYIGF